MDAETRLTFSPGPCPWAADQGRDQQCTSWKTSVCPPAKCERKKWAAQERAKEMRRYREFPGNPFQVATKAKAKAFREQKVSDWWTAALPKGHCRWCGGEIWSDKDPTKLNLRRTWHRSCLHRYNLHTRAEVQLPHLVDRDGPGCRLCGKVVGAWWHWTPYGSEDGIHPGENPETMIAWRREMYPPEIYVAPFCSTFWVSGLQVDHVIALGVVVLTIPEARRWRFWGPGNLAGLCHPCHVQKTKNDVRLMRGIRNQLSDLPDALLPEWRTRALAAVLLGRLPGEGEDSAPA